MKRHVIIAAVARSLWPSWFQHTVPWLAPSRPFQTRFRSCPSTRPRPVRRLPDNGSRQVQRQSQIRQHERAGQTGAGDNLRRHRLGMGHQGPRTGDPRTPRSRIGSPGARTWSREKSAHPVQRAMENIVPLRTQGMRRSSL